MTVIDFDRYTLGELALIERLAGLPVAELVKPDAPMAKKVSAIYLVEKKRLGEAVTWEQVLQLKAADVLDWLTDTLGGNSNDDEPDPKETSSKPKRKTSRSSSSGSASSPPSTGD